MPSQLHELGEDWILGLLYAEHFTDASDLEALSPDFRMPEGVAFEALRADRDGWMARLVREEDGQGCLLSYGGFGLVGWSAGAGVCWAEARGRAATD